MLPMHVTLSANLGFKEPVAVKISYKPSPDFISPETIAYDLTNITGVVKDVELVEWIFKTDDWSISAVNEQYSGQMEAVRRLLESAILLDRQGETVVK